MRRTTIVIAVCVGAALLLAGGTALAVRAGPGATGSHTTTALDSGARPASNAAVLPATRDRTKAIETGSVQAEAVPASVPAPTATPALAQGAERFTAREIPEEVRAFWAKPSAAPASTDGATSQDGSEATVRDQNVAAMTPEQLAQARARTARTLAASPVLKQLHASPGMSMGSPFQGPRGERPKAETQQGIGSPQAAQ